MKLKSQIRIGYSFLLFIIIFLIAFSIFFLNRLDKASDRILKENYVTIQAAQEMLSVLTELNENIFLESTEKNKSVSQQNLETEFRKNLQICLNNITEHGERKILTEIQGGFKEYTEMTSELRSHSSDIYNQIHMKFGNIFDKVSYLIDMNQNASLTKNAASREAFKSAWLYVLIFGALSIIIAYVIIFKIPSTIIKPLEETTNKITRIAEGDYQQRIEIKENNEIGQLADSFNKMVEKLFEYENSNRFYKAAQKSRLESVVNSLNDAIIVFDEQNKFVLLNTKASLLLNIDSVELIGKSAVEFSIHNNIIRDILKFLSTDRYNIQQDKKERYLKIESGGKEEYYIVEVTDVYDSENHKGKKFLGYITALKNVTLFKEMDDAKTHFIAALSHELRTPLSAIKMSVNLLQNYKVGSLNSSQEQLINSIKEETQRLLRITGELLDISKIETRHIKLNFNQTDPLFIINYSISPFINQIAEKHINLVKNIEKELPQIKVDPEKISWVILNLLANAIRFTPVNGEIRITVISLSDGIEFIIGDSGPGIAEEYREKVFGKYFQEPGRRDYDEGLGLGLAICKEIIDAHKGKIWVDSEKGKGSNFHFCLPV